MAEYIINIEYSAVAIMVIGLVILFINRTITGLGIGKRTIQYTTLVLALPILFVLALEKIIVGETAAALIGVIAGYTLSSIVSEKSED